MSKAVVSAALAALQFGTVAAHDSQKLILTDMDHDRHAEEFCRGSKKQVLIDAHWTPYLWTGKKTKRACRAEAKKREQNWVFVRLKSKGADNLCYLGDSKPSIIPEGGRGKYLALIEDGTEADYGCYKKDSEQVQPYACEIRHGEYLLNESWKWEKIYAVKFEKRKAKCSEAAEKAGLNWILRKERTGIISGYEYWACYLGEGLNKHTGHCYKNDLCKDAYVGCFEKSPITPLCSEDQAKSCDEFMKRDGANEVDPDKFYECWDQKECIWQSRCTGKYCGNKVRPVIEDSEM